MSPKTRSGRKILFLVPTLRGGGAERVIVTLTRHLDRTRFQIVLGVTDASGAVYRDDVPADVAVVDLASDRVRKSIPGALRLIWRVRPDLVFSTMANLNLSLIALRWLMPRGTALVGREATIVSEQLKELEYSALWRIAYRRLYPRFDVVVCQSRYMQRDLVENHGIALDKTVVIHNPVDVERISAAVPLRERRRAPGEPLRLVAAGRLSEVKGFDLLLEALARLPDLQIQLTILGEGPLRGALEARVAALGLTRSVSLPGFKPDPHRFFGEADALVLSSRYEGFPNVVLEALACGIGVISTPALGGVSEILEGVAGTELASEVSADALARAIRTWAERPFPGIAPSALDRFRTAEIAGRYARLFESVCDRTGRAAAR